MTLDERIRAILADGATRDDDELAALLGTVRQNVNVAGRRLAAAERIYRASGANGKIVNSCNPLPEVATSAPLVTGGVRGLNDPLITEDEIKRAVKEHLEAGGYRVEVKWGHVQGIDLVATGPAGQVVIEAKGEAMLQPQQVNYFLGSIGELVQRLDDPNAIYALALPDNPQFRGLVRRLSALARERIVQRVYLVARSADGLTVNEV
jgi:hypothetical protein